MITDTPRCSSNDALRKHGILQPLPKPPRTPSPPPSPTFEQTLSNKTTDEIDTLLLEAQDSETERLILAFREQRLKDLKKEERKGRFGSVLPIGRDDYNREVTEASKVDDRDEDEDDDDEIKGTGVVCFLYKEGYVVQLTLFLALKVRSCIFIPCAQESCPQRPTSRTITNPCSAVLTDQIHFNSGGQVHTELSGLDAPNADSLSKRRDHGAAGSMGYKERRSARRYVP